MNSANETHTLELLRRTDDGFEEWFCTTCGRHMTLRNEPTFAQVIFAEGDPQASHSNYAEGMQAEALAPLVVELRPVVALVERQVGMAGADSTLLEVNAFIDFGDPETSDGLAPWIAFLKRLG